MKKLTLILSMLIALVSYNANAAIYLVGNEPVGQGWNPSKGIEMTDNGDGTYTYDVIINGDVWFCFAEALGANADDWNNFNTNYRYGPHKNGGNEVITAGQWTVTQKQGNGDGSYQFHGSGDKYTITFDLTNLRFMIDGYVEPIVYESFTVAGNNADIFGAEWNVTLEANDMTLDETDGLYKLVKENVEINNAPYTLYYKVAANHAWGESWGNPNGPDGNQDYVFNENGTYDLTFKFNFDTKEVTLDAVQTQVGPEVDEYYIVAGTPNLFGSEWAATDTLNLMTEGEAGMFTWTKTGFEATAGTLVQYKVVANGNWNTCWPVSDENGDHNMEYEFDQDGVYTVVITFNEETKEINLTATRTGDLPEPPQPEVDPVYIMGNVNGYSWDAITGVEMAYDATTKVYTAEINVDDVNNGLGYFGFTKKLADSESENPWGDIEPFRFGPMAEGEGNWVMTEDLLGVDCELDLEGSYYTIEIPAGTWNVAVDLNNGLFKINGTWPTDTVVPEVDNVYIMGNVNDLTWDAISGVEMTYDAENEVYTAEINVTDANNGKGYFGFTKKLADPESENPWGDIEAYRFGPVAEGEGNWVMTEELLGADCALATDGSYYTIEIPAGTWVVTVDLVNNVFTINGEWPVDTVAPEPYTGDIFIMGNVNDLTWDAISGVQMTYDAENEVYTAEINVADVNEGKGYFGFTKKLADAESATPWDDIAAFRFGPVCDPESENWVLTEELIGVDCALATDGSYKSIEVDAGQWAVTVDMVNNTFNIKKAGMLGDVNSDNTVNITDVTILINAVMSENFSTINFNNSDMNGDGNINITDVTMLINAVMAM